MIQLMTSNVKENCTQYERENNNDDNNNNNNNNKMNFASQVSLT